MLQKGYEKTLIMTGVGYRAALKGELLNLQLGFSHDINYKIPQGIKIVIEKQTTIKISGNDKEQVGRVAAEIKVYRPVEAIQGKRYKREKSICVKKRRKKEIMEIYYN